MGDIITLPEDDEDGQDRDAQDGVLSAEEFQAFKKWRSKFSFLTGTRKIAWRAAQEGHVAFVRYFLHQGYGHEFLHYAAKHNKLDEGRVLIEAGIAIDRMGGMFGGTALIAAAVKNHPDFVQMLCEAGAHLDLVDLSGDTALINAALRGHLRVVKILAAAGADLDIINHNNIDAAEYAIKNGKHAISDFLIRFKERRELEERNERRQRLLLPPPASSAAPASSAFAPAPAPAQKTSSPEPEDNDTPQNGWSAVSDDTAQIAIHYARDKATGTHIKKIFDFHAQSVFIEIGDPKIRPHLLEKSFNDIAPALLKQARQAVRNIEKNDANAGGKEKPQTGKPSLT